MSNWPNVVTIGGVLLDVDDGTSFRVVEDIPGWDDAPAIHDGLQTKAQQDGAWDGTGFDDARVVNLSGLVDEATPQAAYGVLRALSALRPQSIHELVVVNASIGSLSAMVRVTVGVKPVWIGDTAFEYTMTVTAPDSLKYGAPTYATATLSTATPGAGKVYPVAYPLDYGIAPGVTPGAVLVANAGTAAYWPRLRILGPVTNPVVTLVESGAWVRFTGSLLAGQWLDLDMANRRVLLQGQVSVRQSVSSAGDWLCVPPGGGSVVWSADTADPASLLSVWSYEGSWS
jgi:hypothetical protein